MKTLDISYQDHIATVTLNRPDKKNAMSFEMMRELIAAAKTLRQDRNLRAVILTGSAQTFCAGIDLADLKNTANRKTVFWELIKPTASLFQRAALVWHELPVPVIAAVEGHALGAGLQLALAADYCIAHPNSRWAIREAHWGIIPDMGISVTARGRIRNDILYRLTATAELFDSEAAAIHGFVTELNDTPLLAAQALATEFSQRSPDALLAAKRMYNKLYGCQWPLIWREKYWQLKLLTGRNQSLAIRKDKHPDTLFKPRQFK